jgi:hypothetical protein
VSSAAKVKGKGATMRRRGAAGESYVAVAASGADAGLWFSMSVSLIDNHKLRWC